MVSRVALFRKLKEDVDKAAKQRENPFAVIELLRDIKTDVNEIANTYLVEIEAQIKKQEVEA